MRFTPATHFFSTKRNCNLALLLVAIISLFGMFERVYPNYNAVIYSDSEGYFWYLPAVLGPENFRTYSPGSANMRTNEQGEIVNKYTYGVAYFQLPAFILTYALRGFKDSGREDFLSAPYAYAVAFSGFLVGFIGAFFLQLALYRYFKPVIALVTVLCIFFGTNLFHYVSMEMGMSHAYSFALFAFVLWLTPIVYERPSYLKLFAMGLALGWIVLIRPTNAMVLLFVLLYDIDSVTKARERLQLIGIHFPKLLVAALAAILMLFPQLLYWKLLTGSFITYSYTGESFVYWHSPKILSVLFDTQNGLFFYSPMALLLFVGIVVTAWKNVYQGRLNFLLFGLATYVFASWWAWWFGGAFGHRCYVEFFALFSISLAYVIEHFNSVTRRFRRFAFQFVLLFLVYYQIHLSYFYVENRPFDGEGWVWSMEKAIWLWSEILLL